MQLERPFEIFLTQEAPSHQQAAETGGFLEAPAFLFVGVEKARGLLAVDRRRVGKQACVVKRRRCNLLDTGTEGDTFSAADAGDLEVAEAVFQFLISPGVNTSLTASLGPLRKT